MKQAVMTAPGQIEIRNVPAPVPGPGEVLLRIQRIGVCGSDIHVYHGKHPLTGYPVIQGHEFAATVEAAAPGVTGFAPGAKVTALPQITCGTCAPCRRGDYHICDNLKVRGFQAPGCAQELWAAPAEKIVPLPAGFTFEQGALVEPAAVAAHAVDRAGSLAGRNVAVLGAGPIGNLVAQTAHGAGARVLIVDPSDFRLEIANRCGLESTSNPKRETLNQASARVFGAAGFNAAFECSGAEAAVTAAVESIQKAGTIVVVAVFAGQPRVNLALVQDRELTLHGTLMYRREDYERAVEGIASGAIRTDPLVTKHFPLADYLEAYRFIESNGERTMKVMIDV